MVTPPGFGYFRSEYNVVPKKFTRLSPIRTEGECGRVARSFCIGDELGRRAGGICVLEWEAQVWKELGGQGSDPRFLELHPASGNNPR